MACWSQLGLQDAISPIMEELTFFHDFTNMILMFIMMFISGMLTFTLKNTVYNKILMSGQFLETIWTMFPMVILIQIGLPSLVLLYLMETPEDSFVDFKVMGHQWYWNYQFYNSVEFDSIMLPADECLDTRQFRNLEVDTRLILPYKTPIRALITSADVLHCWTVPSLGVKADAAPGRLNQLTFMSHRPGVFYGQCSEICGANHSFMPIAIEFIKPMDYINLSQSW